MKTNSSGHLILAAVAAGLAGAVRATTLDVGAGATVTYGADDAAAVAALTQITFADAEGRVELKDGSFALGASVSGAGTVAAIDAAALTLTGDRRGFTGNWFFTNSTVTAASRYCFGDANTTEVLSWRGSKEAPLTFTGDGLTNDVPLRIHYVHGLNGTDGRLVFNGAVSIDSCGSMYTAFNCANVEFNGGLYCVGNTWPSPSLALGTEGWISSSGNRNGGNGGWLCLNNGAGSERGTWHFSGVNRWEQVRPAASIDVVCEDDDCFLADKTEINLINNAYNVVDLNGHDQTVACVYQSGYTPAASGRPTKSATVMSVSPATVTFTKSTYQSKANALAFGGAVSLVYNAPDTTYILGNVISTSTGDLTVSGGTLVLQNGYRWKGAHATVTGGTLQLDSTDSFLEDTTELTVASPGQVALGSGVTACFSSATIGGAAIAEGTYTVAQLEAAYPVAAGLVTGSGSISVGEHLTPYVGELVIVGTAATVPKSATVYLGSADIARVAPLTTLTFGNSLSKVVCTNETGTMSLAAAISGAGEFRAWSSAGLVLSGDNSAFAGSFVFSNSAVTVSSRYGLGGADTAGVFSYAGSQANPLTLTGAGRTCDVPVSIKDLHDFATEAGDEIVFTKPFTLLQPTSGSYARMNLGNVDFRAGLNQASTWPTLQLAENRTAKLHNVSAAGRWFIFGAQQYYYKGCLYRLSGNNAWGEGHIQYTSLACDSANCLGSSGQYLSFTVDWGNMIDINGYDQNAALYYDPGTTASGAIVTNSSATAATFTINGTPYEKHNAIRFSGNLSLAYDSAKTWYLTSKISTATGALTVRQGTFVIESDAGWRGSDAVVDGGTLSVTSTKAFEDDTTALEVKSGTLSVAADVTVYFKSAKIGGTKLAAGVYSVADLAESYPGLVSGSGTLAVGQHSKIVVVAATWTGASGDGKLTTDANWQGGAAPDLAGGGADVTFETTEAEAAVDAADLAAYGLHFASAGNFTLGGAQALGLGAGGISSVNPAPATVAVVTNAIAAPLAVALTGGGDIGVGAQTVLALDGAISGGATAQEIGVGGSGVLRLAGDHSGLEAKVNLTNRETRVHSSTALGAPTRQTYVRCSAFRVHCDEIDTPLAVLGYGQSPADPYLTRNDVNRIFAEPGHAVTFRRLLSTDGGIAGVWLANDITFAGGLEHTGGFFKLLVDPGFSGGVLGGAIEMANSYGQYPFEITGGGTLGLAVTNNVWHRLLLTDTGTVARCRAAGTLLESSPLCFGYRNVGLNDQGKVIQAGPSGALDLNGFNQTVSYLSHEKKVAADPNDITNDVVWCGEVTSATPATLTLTGVAGNHNTDTLTVGHAASLRIRGAASLKIASAAGVEQRLLYRASDTTGTVEVASGILTLADGAAFPKAARLAIGATGRVNLDAAAVAAQSFRPSSVSIADGGILELPAGTQLRVRELTVSGIPLGGGTWGGAEARAAGKVDAAHTLDCFAGAGTLRLTRGVVLVIR